MFIINFAGGAAFIVGSASCAYQALSLAVRGVSKEKEIKNLESLPFIGKIGVRTSRIIKMTSKVALWALASGLSATIAYWITKGPTGNGIGQPQDSSLPNKNDLGAQKISGSYKDCYHIRYPYNELNNELNSALKEEGVVDNLTSNVTLKPCLQTKPPQIKTNLNSSLDKDSVEINRLPSVLPASNIIPSFDYPNAIGWNDLETNENYSEDLALVRGEKLSASKLAIEFLIVLATNNSETKQKFNREENFQNGHLAIQDGIQLNQNISPQPSIRSFVQLLNSTSRLSDDGFCKAENSHGLLGNTTVSSEDLGVSIGNFYKDNILPTVNKVLSFVQAYPISSTGLLGSIAVVYKYGRSVYTYYKGERSAGPSSLYPRSGSGNPGGLGGVQGRGTGAPAGGASGAVGQAGGGCAALFARFLRRDSNLKVDDELKVVSEILHDAVEAFREQGLRNSKLLNNLLRKYLVRDDKRIYVIYHRANKRILLIDVLKQMGLTAKEIKNFTHIISKGLRLKNNQKNGVAQAVDSAQSEVSGKNSKQASLVGDSAIGAAVVSQGLRAVDPLVNPEQGQKDQQALELALPGPNQEADPFLNPVAPYPLPVLVLGGFRGVGPLGAEEAAPPLMGNMLDGNGEQPRHGQGTFDFVLEELGGGIAEQDEFAGIRELDAAQQGATALEQPHLVLQGFAVGDGVVNRNQGQRNQEAFELALPGRNQEAVRQFLGPLANFDLNAPLDEAALNYFFQALRVDPITGQLYFLVGNQALFLGPNGEFLFGQIVGQDLAPPALEGATLQDGEAQLVDLRGAESGAQEIVRQLLIAMGRQPLTIRRLLAFVQTYNQRLRVNGPQPVLEDRADHLAILDGMDDRLLPALVPDGFRGVGPLGAEEAAAPLVGNMLDGNEEQPRDGQGTFDAVLRELGGRQALDVAQQRVTAIEQAHLVLQGFAVGDGVVNRNQVQRNQEAFELALLAHNEGADEGGANPRTPDSSSKGGRRRRPLSADLVRQRMQKRKGGSGSPQIDKEQGERVARQLFENGYDSERSETNPEALRSKDQQLQEKVDDLSRKMRALKSKQKRLQEKADALLDLMRGVGDS